MNLPRTFEELDELRRGFELKSTDEVMSGCIGASDGMSNNFQLSLSMNGAQRSGTCGQ